MPFESVAGRRGFSDGGSQGGDLGQAAGQKGGLLAISGGLVKSAAGEVLLAALSQGAGETTDQLLALVVGGEVRSLGEGESLVQPGVGKCGLSSSDSQDQHDTSPEWVPL